MRRWLNAAALARPAPTAAGWWWWPTARWPPVQALLRWDPGWFAARELAERRELRLPAGGPDGQPHRAAPRRWPSCSPRPGCRTGAEVLGPVPAADDQERMLVRVPARQAAELAHALHEAAAVRSARKAALPVRIQMDPADLF